MDTENLIMDTENLHPIELVPPQELALDADFPALSMALSKVLLRRRSCREFGPGELSLYRLSRLLWAAFGINRPEQGLRTAPSAANGQEIGIYVALRNGVYRYDAGLLALLPVAPGDLRAACGEQDYVAGAAVNLIYVATFPHRDTATRTEQQFYAALDTGFIGQNVYLFCAAEGLATVFRGWLDRAELGAKLGLGPHQLVVAAQSVGFATGGSAADPEPGSESGPDSA
nr:SagB/ThcOx family dehydrogenase [uncultured Duganella sp.]